VLMPWSQDLEKGWHEIGDKPCWSSLGLEFDENNSKQVCVCVCADRSERYDMM
jgi:hypothetical protein